MTRRTNARIAGFTFLFYIAVAFPAMVLMERSTNAQGMAATLVRIAEHSTDMRIVAVLELLACFAALMLAVTLYRITRDADPDLAVLAVTCRVAEGVVGAVYVPATLGLLWLATATGANAPGAATANALGEFLMKMNVWNTMVASMFFAVGSTTFAWLLLRGRMIPAWLSWLGVVGSALLVAGLPAQLAGLIGKPITGLMWIPVGIFELTLAPWLIIKGVAPAGGAAT